MGEGSGYERSMARPLPSRSEIVSCLLASGRPLHARELASQLSVGDGQLNRFSELLDQLCLDQTIQRSARSRFRARPSEATRQEGWEGLLAVNPRGFGFVSAAGHDDVFVGSEGLGGALHGDRVQVGQFTRSSRGLEGRVTAIVERRSERVAGVLTRRGRSAWLVPDDARLRGPIVLNRADTMGRDGEAAVVRITRFPDTADQNPEGELLAVLGAPGEPPVEVAKILLREQIVEEHPEAAMQQAEAQAASLLPKRTERRLDLRHLPLPTIDPKDARDHDDAVWVEKTRDGYRATVAIADVSEFVSPGTPLEDEARARGCTIYLPDRALPMLPTALAADLCSLLPERDRLCLAVIIELDRHGEVTSFALHEAVMRSAAMLTYEGVARTLGFTEKGPQSHQAETLRSGLQKLDELAQKLRRRRLLRGAMDLELPEAQVVIDPKTREPTDVVRRVADPSIRRAYQMVEELMILANELVAQWLSERRSLTVYRVHAPPDPERLERLLAFARQLGLRLDLEEFSEPKGLGRFLTKIRDHDFGPGLMMLALRSLKPAVYDIVNRGHFGLASDAYLHFTSPIRRYPDLLVHRTVKAHLRGLGPSEGEEAIERMRQDATQSSQRERAAMAVEREVVDLYRARLMQERIGEQLPGTVTGLSPHGVYVALDAPFVDVFVHFDTLGEDSYRLSDDEVFVVGERSGERIVLGQRMLCLIEDVNLLRRQVLGRRVVTPRARRAPKEQKQVTKSGRRTRMRKR